jgi:pSer/pThr/pTyr-binding forkhead associated (FHA) protein
VATLDIYDEFDRRGMPVNLTGSEVTIGRGADNVVVVEEDDTVSRYHLILKPVGNSWDVRDVGARNGTLLNGERLTHEVILRDGDELRIGNTRLKYLNPESGRDPATTTRTIDEPPHLTPREHEVLVHLCLPRLDGTPFTPPATAHEIAKDLFVGRPAVSNHLVELYRKFDIPEKPDRRADLANAAMYRRAVTMEQLREAKKKKNKRDEEGG